MSEAFAEPHLRTLTQLATEARRAESLAELGFVMANRTQRLLPCAAVYWWRAGGRGRGRLLAASGVSNVESDAPFVIWLERVLARLARQRADRAPRPITTADLAEPERAGWTTAMAPAVLWCPLGAPNQRLDGGLLLMRPEPWRPDEIARAEHLAEIYGHAIRTLAPSAERSLLPRQWRTPKVIGAAVVALALLSLVPVNQSVIAPATVVARDPLVVAAPLDGVIKSVDVAPNQPVAYRQVLFHMDDTTIRAHYESAVKALAVVQADYLKTQQQSFSDLDSKARLALLRAQIAQRESDVTYFKDLLDRAVVTAPAAGLALFESPNDWVGRPVTTGMRVMTLADPASAELEVRLPIDDALVLDADAPVLAFLNVAPLASLRARLAHASYEATPTPEGYLAYRLEARFETGVTPPRIGLKATAKLVGRRVPLFIYIFRRPLTLVRQWVGF